MTSDRTGRPDATSKYGMSDKSMKPYRPLFYATCLDCEHEWRGYSPGEAQHAAHWHELAHPRHIVTTWCSN
jgi:hypothetical protein